MYHVIQKYREYSNLDIYTEIFIEPNVNDRHEKMRFIDDTLIQVCRIFKTITTNNINLKRLSINTTKLFSFFVQYCYGQYGQYNQYSLPCIALTVSYVLLIFTYWSEFSSFTRVWWTIGNINDYK